jgi:hypothetical protein
MVRADKLFNRRLFQKVVQLLGSAKELLKAPA